MNNTNKTVNKIHVKWTIFLLKRKYFGRQFKSYYTRLIQKPAVMF